MKLSYLALAEAKFTMGDFNDTVLQQVGVRPATMRVKTLKDNVAGVQLPVFEHVLEGADAYELTGLFFFLSISLAIIIFVFD